MDPGSPALLRHVLRDRVGWAVPVVVVEDAPARMALLRVADTAIKAPARTSVTELIQKLASDDYEVVDATWEHTNALEIFEPGRWHSIWPMWLASGWDFLGWYVNFQVPPRRSRFGWDTFDLALDIVVGPDLAWHWKDEDHFELLQRVGVISADEAAAVQADAQAIIAAIERRAYPFDRDWTSWRPDPSWARPVLPADWAVL